MRSQPGSTAKAVFSLERFCPHLSMAPVLAIVKMVAGIVLNKEQGPNPDGETVSVSPPGPGQVEFNKEKVSMKSQPWKKSQRDKNQNKKANSNPTPSKWNEMNRKQRREMMRKMQNDDLNLEGVHPDVAGIDIGNESHYVAVPPSR